MVSPCSCEVLNCSTGHQKKDAPSIVHFMMLRLHTRGVWLLTVGWKDAEGLRVVGVKEQEL